MANDVIAFSLVQLLVYGKTYFWTTWESCCPQTDQVIWDWRFSSCKEFWEGSYYNYILLFNYYYYYCYYYYMSSIPSGSVAGADPCKWYSTLSLSKWEWSRHCVHASTTFPGLTEMTATHLICGGNLFLEIAIMPQTIIDYVTSTLCVLISVAASYTLAIV